ncbi:hypothetical protein M9H77_31548 [Catharanthus roseus]|uniref:Uncharacterized protein n=1 Tax=Catharanthus roseus TaxID=4058 RepID=A0ACC0A4A1_CATRO|nr:hypothetical protein M9H77_31548 [Catharanthus roseus]
MSASLKNKRVKRKSKEIVVLEKSEEVSTDEDGKLAYKSIKTIDFFPSNSYLSFEIYFKEINFGVINNASIKSIVVGFGLEGFQVGGNMVQAIQDWLISNSAFKEKSFPGLAIFYKKYIKHFSTIASSLIDVPEKKTRFPWQICLHLHEIASNQVPYSTTLYSSLEVDYGFKLLMSFDSIPFSIGHVLCLDENSI